MTCLTAIAALITAGCDSKPRRTEDDADYTEVCVDGQGYRVDDEECPDPGHSSGGGFHYVYVPRSHAVPAVGHPVAGATPVRPAGVKVAKAPTGGFGGRGAGSTGS